MEHNIRAKFSQFKLTPLLERLQEYFEEAETVNLFHIDVYGLADEWKIERREMLEGFIRTVSLGICDLHWEFHCPMCGGVARESLRLAETNTEDYCPACDMNFTNTLDDNIEVFFNISENLRPLPEDLKKSYMAKVAHDISHNHQFDWKTDHTISGMDCLGNSLFRDIFGHETIPPDQSLAIKFSAILFTDIKGSTAMYERLGDARAFKLVKEHFEILFQWIKKNNGLPIKTIGDAVMGVFHCESDAIHAAFQSQKALREFYRGKEEKIEVKIGLHSGPAIVVTLNDVLDYFGSTVNIAARIQGLSRPNQVVFTEAVYNDSSKLLAKYVGKLKRSRHNLKGLSENFTVYHADCDGESCRF